MDIILKASLPKLREKLLESLQAVLPIVAIVLVLCFSIAPVSPSILLCFLLGAAMIIVGIMFFTLGAEMSMTPMGERVGTMLTRSRSLPLIIGVGFLLGFLITISEPDLQVLANQVPSIPNNTLIFSVAGGVGLFLVVAFLRMLFGVALPRLLVVFYGLIFLLAAFVPKEFLSVAFDSGGVTTGPITVPFIMALGVGVWNFSCPRTPATCSSTWGTCVLPAGAAGWPRPPWPTVTPAAVRICWPASVPWKGSWKPSRPVLACGRPMPGNGAWKLWKSWMPAWPKSSPVCVSVRPPCSAS